mmetsp:Transcript_22577/g.27225  ORF Transcript_22577/g.27225 Transcript_22577/m.27225 type:complete len:304 (+) Transcript_22577:89-1000(+)
MQSIASLQKGFYSVAARTKHDSNATQISQPVGPAAASLCPTPLKLKKSPDYQRSYASLSRRTVRSTCTSSTPATNGAKPTLPKPKVRIDNLSDPLATIVIVEYGDILGELLDTIAALKNLSLNIVRANFTDATDDTVTKHRFYVTDARTSEKVFDSERLEEIRITIINMMVTFHPEAENEVRSGVTTAGTLVQDASERLPLGPREAPVIPTSVKVSMDGSGARSRLDIVTTDRPGLLVEVVRTLKDVSVNVVSAEVDTIGFMAHDSFFLTYQGTALSPPMEELVQNALYYYLVLGEVCKEESY